MEFKRLWGCQISVFKSLCRKYSRRLKSFAENPSVAAGAHNKIPALDCIEIPKRNLPSPFRIVEGSYKYIYINPQTHPKESLRQKGLGAGRNFTSKVSKSNTLPIQISLTLVETSGGTTSVGLWFQSLLW